MARLARLALADWPHYLIQRGHSGQPVFMDDEDRRSYLRALHLGAAEHRVALHAYVLGDSEVQLLASPPSATALSQWLQGVGRRYVLPFNRRHGRHGALWDGRFRGAVVERGDMALACLRLIDSLHPAGAGPAASSAAHHRGAQREPRLIDAPEYWALGNTPFEREAAWRALAEQPLPADLAARLREAALRGWPVGSAAFLQMLAAQQSRPVAPRPRGRPRAAA